MRTRVAQGTKRMNSPSRSQIVENESFAISVQLECQIREDAKA